MKIENTRVMNFENALRGMRNPKDSWHLSDSRFGLINLRAGFYDMGVADSWSETNQGVDAAYGWLHKNAIIYESNGYAEVANIGPKDMKLARQLISAGSEHRKFLRQIFVCADVTAPLFHYKELDTYKTATVANSTSTMHKLTAYPITPDRFELGDYEDGLVIDKADNPDSHWPLYIGDMCAQLEDIRQMYLKTGDKRYWKELVRWLPNGWLQTRTWSANYETLQRIYYQRKDHKLTEWHIFCDWIKTLPYANELILNLPDEELPIISTWNKEQSAKA